MRSQKSNKILVCTLKKVTYPWAPNLYKRTSMHRYSCSQAIHYTLHAFTKMHSAK